MSEQISKTKMRGSATTYIIGFLLSIILTLGAYIPVVIHQNSFHTAFTHEVLIPLVLLFAFLQLLVQLIFFLHMASEEKPRWNLVFFGLTAGAVLLIVIASIWIMNNLNYNMMPHEVDQVIMEKENIQK